MSSHSYRHRGLLAVMLLALVTLLCGAGTLAAQDQPSPKWELFGGYSVFQPGADVHGVLPGGLLPVSSRLEANPRGAGASLTYDFNRWLGITLDASTHWGNNESGVAKRIDDTGFSNLSLGPKFTFRHRRFSPFLEVLVGDHRLMPAAFHDIDKLGFMAGGGLDLNLSRHVALRLIRADYVFSNYRYGPSASTSETDIRGVRLQAGINFMFGGGKPAPVPPSAACSVEPAEVFAGESVTMRANGTGFNPNRTIKYSWSGNAAKAGGTEASSQVDTTGLQPGPYQMTANLSDGSKDGSASCSASFTVKQPRPPEISCSSDPQTVRMGGTATIRSSASNPDNRRLTYSYRASSGDISGTDATATLNASGAQPVPITVTCTVSDDRNPALSASAVTTVAVEAPPPPEPPAEVKELEIKLSLHSIYFQTARPTEKNPGGGLMESQEAVLATLATGFNRYLTFKPDAHLILGGHADSRGSEEFNKRLTERRVERAKSFLIEHGVPAGSIEIRSFGKEDTLDSAQVKQQIHDNPDLTEDDRQKMLNHLTVIVLANNRRVDITLSTTGQQSVHRYPFNAKDAMSLISEKGVEKQPSKRKPVKK
jgi:outer membrane protein OmpA-like peptidoglycan-associated protein